MKTVKGVKCEIMKALKALSGMIRQSIVAVLQAAIEVKIDLFGNFPQSMTGSLSTILQWKLGELSFDSGFTFSRLYRC